MKTKLNCLLGLCLGSFLHHSAALASPCDDNFMIRIRAIEVMPAESSSITPIGGHVEAGNSLVPEIDFTYFFTENIVAELILATTRHTMSADATAVGNVDVGSVRLLPPTLTLLYRIPNGTIVPYLGLGVNYTVFYDENAGVLDTVDYDDNWGFVLQAGIDFPLCDNKYYFNFDVKKVFLDTTATFNNGAIVADVDLNPWIIGAGFGIRF